MHEPDPRDPLRVGVHTQLVPVTTFDLTANGPAAVLYRLLQERPERANISHRGMPTWEQHLDFVMKRPYKAWYIIEHEGRRAGAIYLTRQNEIGIALLKAFQRQGLARQSIITLCSHYEGPFLANVAPGNHTSHGLFTKLGFEVAQHTYRME